MLPTFWFKKIKIKKRPIVRQQHSGERVVPLYWTLMLPTKPQGWKLRCCSNMWLQNTVSNTQLNVKLENSYFGLNEECETRGINPSSQAGRKYTGASSNDRRLTKLRSVLFLVFIQRPASNLQVSQPSFFCTHKKTSITSSCHALTRDRQGLLSPFSHLEPDGDATSSSLQSLHITQFPAAATASHSGAIRPRSPATDRAI